MDRLKIPGVKRRKRRKVQEELHTALSRMKMNGAQVCIVWYNGNFGVSLEVRRGRCCGEWCSLRGAKVRRRTQSEPEKSTSRTTFWWLVETRRSVSLGGTEEKKRMLIWRIHDGCARVASLTLRSGFERTRRRLVESGVRCQGKERRINSVNASCPTRTASKRALGEIHSPQHQPTNHYVSLVAVLISI